VTLNIQRVIPIYLKQDWTIILRTVVPTSDAEAPVVDGAHVPPLIHGGRTKA